MRTGLILLFLVILNSCADLEQPEYLQEIERIEKDMNQKVDEVNELAKGIDSSLIRKGDSIILELKQFETDTIRLEDAQLMNSYQRLQESIPVALKLKTQIDEAISAQNDDLKKLKSDIEKGAGRRGKYAEYVAKEKSKSEELSQQFDRLRVLLQEINDKIEPTTERVIQLIDERNASKEVQ
jgi:chromosome segregation ATPase